MEKLVLFDKFYICTMPKFYLHFKSISFNHIHRYFFKRDGFNYFAIKHTKNKWSHINKSNKMLWLSILIIKINCPSFTGFLRAYYEFRVDFAASLVCIKLLDLMQFSSMFYTNKNVIKTCISKTFKNTTSSSKG